MKKVIFTAIALVAIGGGAFALKNTPAKQKTATSYSYYQDGECNVEILCSDEFEGATCSEQFQHTVLYSQPGCNVAYQVAIPLGKLPAR